MRTSLWLAIALLAITIGVGWWEEAETRVLSDRYVSAAEELHIMVEKAEWNRARETAAAYLESWKETASWLKTIINHEDIDDVTLALERLQACIEAQEKGAGFEACAELRENARHIYHRDAFTLGNVL